MFITNNHDSFYLWWHENFVKHQNVSRYYNQNCRVSSKYFVTGYSFWNARLELFFHQKKYYLKSDTFFSLQSKQKLFASNIWQIFSDLENILVIVTLQCMKVLIKWLMSRCWWILTKKNSEEFMNHEVLTIINYLNKIPSWEAPIMIFIIKIFANSKYIWLAIYQRRQRSNLKNSRYNKNHLFNFKSF